MARRPWIAVAGGLAGVVLAHATPAGAQVVPCSATETSSNLPPAGSPPVLRCYQVIVHPDGSRAIDNETYSYYLRPLEQSLPSQNSRALYKEIEVLNAFTRLVKTNFLEDLWVEVIDEPYENAVIGKHVIFHLEERLRVKAISYTGSTEVDTSAIERALKDRGVLRPEGGFVEDYSVLLRKIRGVIRDLYAEHGYPSALVEVRKTPMPGADRFLQLTFDIKAGPKVRGPI